MLDIRGANCQNQANKAFSAGACPLSCKMGGQPMSQSEAPRQANSANSSGGAGAGQGVAAAETLGPNDHTVRIVAASRGPTPVSEPDQQIVSSTKDKLTAVVPTTSVAALPAGSVLPEKGRAPQSTRLPWVFRTTGSVRIDVYRLVLFLLILAYYGGWIVAIVQLTELTLRLPRVEWFESPGWFVAYYFYLRLMLPFLYRAARHVWRGMYGLVTSQHDEADAEIEGLPLGREEHPELYAAVAEVARRVGAPSPDEILVSHKAECYVSERRHFAWRTDRRLVLVLGLPHLCVLSLAEMQVILAHELGHFHRGDTSLGVFAFRFLESLRTATDERAARRFRHFDPVYIAARLYFHLFLYLAAPIRRFQELRADGFSASAYGGDLAVRTLLKEWHLALQFDGAVASFEPDEDSSDDDLAPTVFDWFARDWRGLSDEGQAYLERRLSEEERPSFSDSHPTTAVRIAALREYAAVEAADSRPARQLIPNLRSLKQRLHDRVFRADMVPTAPLR